MDTKTRLLSNQVHAVDEERRAGNGRLDAKQVGVDGVNGVIRDWNLCWASCGCIRHGMTLTVIRYEPSAPLALFFP